MIKRIITGTAAAVAVGLAALLAYFCAVLPLNISVEAGAELGGSEFPGGFPPAVIKMTDDGAGYYLGNIRLKSVELNEKERPAVILGGKPLGIKLLADGVIVVGTADNSPAKDAGIKSGDVITQVNGKRVYTNEELAEAVKLDTEQTDLVIRRGDGEICKSLTPYCSDRELKIGAWVRDSAAGIGTLTYIDPQTKTFGGLGHAVSDGAKAVPLKSGNITSAEIYDVIKSEKGEAGELCGTLGQKSMGEITQNTPTGIFGDYKGEISGELVPMAFRQEVKTGAAEILTTVDNGEPMLCKIEIERINLPDLTGSKGMIIRITDERLLERTGGIVRGMSGSPIIQDGRFAGAVTHVLLSDPTRGYAVFAETMLDRGD